MKPFLCLIAVVLVATTFAFGSDDSNSKSKRFCGMYKKMDKTECCKVKPHGYKLNIGVCEEMPRSRNGRKIVGFNRKAEKVVTQEEANSDANASENNPGKDEGMCHVYKVFIGHSVCIPGNIVQAVEFASIWMKESDSKEEVCQVDLGLNCHGKVDAAEPYDFAVKLSANAKLELNDDLVAIYGCDTETINGQLYLVCPL